MSLGLVKVLGNLGYFPEPMLTILGLGLAWAWWQGQLLEAPGWLPVMVVFLELTCLDFSSSRKQKLRPSLPNCQFEACHVVNLTLANSVLSIQAFVEGNFLDFLLGMRFKCL